MMKKMLSVLLAGAVLAGAPLFAPGAAGMAARPYETLLNPAAEVLAASIDQSTLTYDVSRFQLPEGARSLVVVEGFAVNGGRDTYREGYVSDPGRWNRARVTAFYRDSDGSAWIPVVQSAAVMGWSGMSNARHSGDGSTPIGLFKMDTPFGRRPAESGFPENYQEIMIADHNQYWSDETNCLELNDDFSVQSGERLYEDWAKGIYSYCLNSGYNKNNAVPGSGSALFLHCTKEGKPSTAGCVAMEEEAMKAILRLYALGPAYVAQAPAGTFEGIYGAYSETGQSPAGEFPASSLSLPETPLTVLY